MIGLKRVVQSTNLVSIFAMVPVIPACRDAIVPITGEKHSTPVQRCTRALTVFLSFS